MACVNTNTKEFKQLMEASGLPSFELELDIAKWQDIHGIDSYPTVNDLKGNVSSEMSNSLDDIIDENNNINWELVDKLQEELFSKEAAYTLKNRPEKHTGEKYTWEHIQNVVKTAQSINIPSTVNRKHLVLAALLHDIGKPYRRENHGLDSVSVINKLFKDSSYSKIIKLAVKYHMINTDTTVEEYKKIIKEAKEQNINPKDFMDLLLALNVSDIIRNRDGNIIDDYSGMSVKDTVSYEYNIKSNKYKQALEESEISNERIEAIQSIFNDNPELTNLGTIEQYNEYLNGIFPDSKVKDIVYHSRFTLDNIKNKNRWNDGFYSGTKDQADLMAEMAEDSGKTMTTSAILIKIEKPKITNYNDRNVNDYKNTNDSFIIEATEKDALQLINGRDGYNTDNFKKEYVVFEPEQIHVLGSKQDIQGFKEYVGNKQEIKDVSLDNKINTINETDIIRYSKETIGESIEKIQSSDIALSSSDGSFDIDTIFEIGTDSNQRSLLFTKGQMESISEFDSDGLHSTSGDRLYGRTLAELWDNRQEDNSKDLPIGLAIFCTQRLTDPNSEYRRITEYFDKTYRQMDYLSIVIENDKFGSPMSATEDSIYINTGVIAKTFFNASSLDNVLHDIDAMLFEEVIHYISRNIISAKQEKEIYNSITQSEKENLLQIRSDLETQTEFVHEYIRMIVQDILTGRITEDLYNVNNNAVNFIRKIFNIIKEALIGVPDTSLIKQKVNEVLSIINKGKNVVVEDRYTLDNLQFQRLESSLPISELEPGYNAEEFDTKEQDMLYATDVLSKMSDILSEQTGIDYAVISEQQAKELIDNYNGEPAFFYKGKAYFVQGKFNSKSVIHEFSHPLIDSLDDNVIQSLYNKLTETSEGNYLVEYVKNLYPELKEGSDDFIKEVLVHALTAKANDLFKVNSKGFLNAVNEILYQIKQMLRKVFGRTVNVSKLNENTTIDELANMLANGTKFKLNTERITNAKIVKFEKTYKEVFVDDILTVGKTNDKLVTSHLYNINKIVKQQIEIVENTRNLKDLSQILTDEQGTGLLRDLSASVGKRMYEVADSARERIEDETAEATLLFDSILKIDKIVAKVLDFMETLSEDEIDSQDRDNITKVYNYMKILKYWEGFIKELEDEALKTKVKTDNPLLMKLHTVSQNIKKARTTANTLTHRGYVDLIMERVMPSFDMIEQKYLGIIKYHEDNKSPQAVIDKFYKELYGLTKLEKARLEELEKTDTTSAEYKVLKDKSFLGVKMNTEKMEKLFKGELGDASFANSFFEGALYNTDPIVSGFASYVKDNITSALNESYDKYNDFIKDIKPLLKKIGYNPYNISDLMNKIGFIDNTGVFNPETGKVETEQVYSFLNAHKDFRKNLREFDQRLSDAEIAFAKDKSEINKNAYRAVKKEIKQFFKDYMYNNYVTEYYTNRDSYFSDEIGVKADELLSERKAILKDLQNRYDSSSTDLEYTENLKDAYRNVQELYYYYDESGKKKTGERLLIAQRLNDYKKNSTKFYEKIPKREAFQRAFQLFQKEFIATGKDIYTDDTNKVYTPEYQEAYDKWITNNTVIKIKPEYFEYKKSLLDEMSKILSQLEGHLTVEEYAIFKDLHERNKLGKLNSVEEKQYKAFIGRDILQVKQFLLFDEMNDLTYKYRDENKQINGIIVEDDVRKRIKELQEELEKLNAEMVDKHGLTAEEKVLIKKFTEAKEAGVESSNILNKLIALQSKSETKGLNALDKKRLEEISDMLSMMTSKTQTQEYVDFVNFFVSQLTDPAMKGRVLTITGNTNQFSKENVSKFINNATLIDKLKEEVNGFKDWFDANHIKLNKGGYSTLNIWKTSKPNLHNHYEQTTVTDINGTEQRIDAMPSNEYFYTRVKREYKEDKIVGKTINNKGEWLPRTHESKAKPKDNRFVNERYFALKNAAKGTYENDLYNVLVKMSEFHLSNQSGLKKNDKLYLDIPRYDKTMLEAIQSNGLLKTVKDTFKSDMPFFTWIIKQLKMYLFNTQVADKDINVELGYNKDQTNVELANADMFDNELSSIHIAGLYKMNIDMVSTDLSQSLVKYMFSAAKQRALREIAPVAQGLVQQLEGESPVKKSSKNPDKSLINKMKMIQKGEIEFLRKKGTYTRLEAVKNLINREFEGQTTKGWGSENKFIQGAMSLMFKRASFGFFALNIPSALKNMVGPKYQQMIEAAGGQYMNPQSLVEGELFSFNAMSKLSFNIYDKDIKPIEVQMLDYFDVMQDRMVEKTPEFLSRTIVGDTMNLSWLYNFRKWTEGEATTAIFGSMMAYQKIKQGEQLIKYLEAFELVDGKMALKKGIDVRYSNLSTEYVIQDNDTLESIASKHNIEGVSNIITQQQLDNIKTKIDKLRSELNDVLETIKNDKNLSEEHKLEMQEQKKDSYEKRIEYARQLTIDNTLFKQMRSRIHQVQNNLQGAYSKFDQPEAQRYLAFRFVSFLRRYFIPMATNRFGYSGNFLENRGRFNIALGDNPTGYYVTVLNSLLNTFRVDKGYLLAMTPQEKSAFFKVIAEVGGIIAISLFISMILGYDPDEEDRFEKLRKRSGVLPYMPGVVEDDRYDFETIGFVKNHLLSLAMQVRTENEQFIPLPKFGLNDYAGMLNLKSLAVGPTLNTYMDMMSLGIGQALGHENVYYKKDAGPYAWQKEGGSKLATKFWKTFGMTGSTVDVVKYIKDSEGYRRQAKGY